MMHIDPAFWADKRVLVTGHTGFKGAWLCLWLAQLGAQVTGFALEPPTRPSLFELAGVQEMVHHRLGDIRDSAAVAAAVVAARPQIILHLAAQPLVRESYAHPLETYQTNVLGTAHLLEAARAAPDLRAVVVVTTDKCYRNTEQGQPFGEEDPLGGYDPYSASKACAELVTASYRSAFFQGPGGSPQVGIATARAGNVIGGGDYAKDRIVPDILRAWQAGAPVVLRNPRAVRPWQDVLEPLGGYLLLAQALYAQGGAYGEAFNFGPEPQGCREVGELADMLCGALGMTWQQDTAQQPHEAALLRLDNTKAKTRLGWRPVLRLEETVAFIAEFAQARQARDMCLAHIRRYQERWL